MTENEKSYGTQKELLFQFRDKNCFIAFWKPLIAKGVVGIFGISTKIDIHVGMSLIAPWWTLHTVQESYWDDTEDPNSIIKAKTPWASLVINNTDWQIDMYNEHLKRDGYVIFRIQS